MPEESEEVQILKAELRKTKVAKEKLKVVVTRVSKECDRLMDVNMSVVEALEQETKKARKEEWSRNKFRGALLGSSNKHTLRKGERDKSRLESVMLEDKLKSYQRSKRSLKEKLSKKEANMLIINYQYKEKVNLAASHGQMLRDKQAKVSALQIEREAKEEVIELLHKEDMK